MQPLQSSESPSLKLPPGMTVGRQHPGGLHLPGFTPNTRGCSVTLYNRCQMNKLAMVIF